MTQDKTAVIDGLEKITISVAGSLVEAAGVYLGMVDADIPIGESHRRLSTITECDLPAGKYVWVDDARNSFGGFFWPIPKKLVLRPGVK